MTELLPFRTRSAEKASFAPAPEHVAPPLAEPWLTVLRVVALATVFLLAAKPSLGQGLTLGHLAALALMPLWLSAVTRYRGALLVFSLGILGVIASLWLTEWSSVDHQTSALNLTANNLVLLAVVASVVVVLWAREFLPGWLVAFAYGLGMLADTFTRSEGFGENPWKTAFAVPLAIMLLSFVWWSGRKVIGVVILVALAAASVVFDSRSYFAEFLIAAVLLGWSMLPAASTKKAPVLRTLAIFGVIALTIYTVGTSLLVEGYLGHEAQIRSAEQVNRAGSILVGGRPELGASLALFMFRPLGYGAGTLANSSDLDVAKAGMKAINYDPENGYVEGRLFGDRFEVHSIAGDLWARFGLPGLALALVALVLVLMIIARQVASRQAQAVVLFVAVQSLWSLLFNPLYTSGPVLALALGLGLTAIVRRPQWEHLLPLPPARSAVSPR